MRGLSSSSGNVQKARPRSSTLPGVRPQKGLVDSAEEPSSRRQAEAPSQKRSRMETVDDPVTTVAEMESPSASQAQRAPVRPPLADYEQPSHKATNGMESTLPPKRPAPGEASPGGSSTVSSKVGGPPPEKRTRFDLPPASSQSNAPSAPKESTSNLRGDPQLLFTPPPESPTSATSARTEPTEPLGGGESGQLPKESGTTTHADSGRLAQPPPFPWWTGGANLSTPWVLLERANLGAKGSERDNAALKKQVEALERERDALTKKLYVNPSDPTTSPAYRRLLGSYEKLEASQEERLERERKNWEEANGAARRRLEEEMITVRILDLHSKSRLPLGTPTQMVPQEGEMSTFEAEVKKLFREDGSAGGRFESRPE
ncbi:hypothetical protein EWM64_g3501 [Hericium alpestre]|uniref:Uncharacterized protein n=1 Tax=Hericium alpestre TaxID=135208 RepID=A0A4Z0A1E6_9AGAM|nr:hypothetical protein EWM64_g3501 [Hericium alpestre]